MKKLVFFIGLLSTLCFSGFGQTYYYQSGDSVALARKSYSSAINDTSGVLVTHAGVFTLRSSSIRTSGNSSNTDSSSLIGVNAGVLSKLASKINFTNDTVSTTGTGANGLFATDTNSSITMTGGSITTGNNLSHGVDASNGGSVTLTDVNITTTGPNSPAIAAGLGGGMVNITGGTIVGAATTAGSPSAGIYSLGQVTVSGASITSNGDNGALIDANGSVNLVNTSLTSALNGVMMQKTIQTPLNGVSFTMSGGSLNAGSGDAFYNKGASGSINISSKAGITQTTGNIVNTLSSGFTVFNADKVTLAGSFVCDNTSSISIAFTDSTALNGSINPANSSVSVSLAMDLTSTWNLTAKSYVPVFTDPSGISNGSVINVSGNGFNVVYDETRRENKYLNTKKYLLQNGGYLTCPTCALGVEDHTSAIPVKYSPNPANTVLNIVISDPLTQKISVFNTLGVKVYESAVSRNASIDVSNWPNGLYFFTLNNQTERVIVMH